MLKVQFSLRSPGDALSLDMSISNVSHLATTSDYEFRVTHRQPGRLRQYPRWAESSRALVARCLALATPGECSLLSNWESAEVTVGLLPGGSGKLRPLSLVTLRRAHADALDVGYAEQASPMRGFVQGAALRPAYSDVWALAEQALRLSAFGDDHLPDVRPLDVPIRHSGGLRYVRTSDIPEPTRSVFEARMAHSTRPLLPDAPDAVYAWDWTDFLGGGR